MNLIQLEQNAELVMRSGLFPDVKKSSEAMIKIQAGTELGFKAMQSMQNFDIIKGKAVIKPVALAALLKASGKYTFKIIEHNEKVCKIEFFEIISGIRESLGFSEYTMIDAEKMGLKGKDNWVKQPKNMLFHRALGQGARYYCADATMMPIYFEDELSDKLPNATITKLQTAVIESLMQRESISIDKANNCLSYFNHTKFNEILQSEYNDFIAMMKDKSVIFNNDNKVNYDVL